MLRLPNDWVWDFWLADDGNLFHLFFLKAPRALRDPELRHQNAKVGHATSCDLVEWEVMADAIGPSDEQHFDDVATWTGSVVCDDTTGTWFMFYTGAGSRENGLKQRIGVASSDDLFTWTKHADFILESDPRWYEALPDVEWFDEAWRDPWVFRAPGADGWHMLITARANQGPPDQRGVIGYAQSQDLLHWHPQAPLSTPDAGFGHLEVTQLAMVEERPVLVFSCLTSELAEARRLSGDRGGIWSLSPSDLLGPYDLRNAKRIAGESLYSGRLVRDRGGCWVMLAFRNIDASGAFVGEITDPIPVGDGDGGITLSFTDSRR
jgi:beta-fructofuranosidase